MMLSELHVRDLALIEEAWLEFGTGMTVLSGETGAGKTVLLGALKLLLGERADASAVRSGATEALVEGRFIDRDSEVVVRRRVSSDGRSRCALEGEMSTVGALAERVGPLVDLHGQHEHQALLSPSSHVGYLDRWAGDACLRTRESYQSARMAWQDAASELDELERALADGRRDAERLRFIIDDIESVAPLRGEDEELRARLPALMHAGRLVEAAAGATELLRGEGGVLDGIAEVQSLLAKVSGIDAELDAIGARLGEVEALASDAGDSVRAYRDSVEHDPAALDSVQSRLAALAGLVRRHGPTLDVVIDTWEAARSALEAVSVGEDTLTAARARSADALEALKAAGAELDGARRSASPGFSTALEEAASELAMEGARFEVSFSDLPVEAWTADGPHRVEFLYSAAPGQASRPLARIASGGEISRVMLALKSVLGSADQVGTLVFDEIDAGIGGSTATAVGARLARLSRSHQVIVVTHLAQVAAFADTHFVVRKIVDADGAATTVAPVEGDGRIAELTRMLSGGDSDAGRVHAAELLALAQEALG